MRFLLQIAYDGSLFHGWQKQSDVRTVQEEIEDKLSQIAKRKIKIMGAGRTDAGVHARKQYAHFDFPVDMSLKQIQKALNSLLPKDIKITNIFMVRYNFSARYSAVKRKYQYVIAKERDPFNRLYFSYITHLEFTQEIVNECLSYFLGKHDFTSFSKYNHEARSQICEVSDFRFSEYQEFYAFEIVADRFLHNMVRRIIGTIITITQKKLEPKIIAELFAAKTPHNKFIRTAPPEGLYLIDVEYPNL